MFSQPSRYLRASWLCEYLRYLGRNYPNRRGIVHILNLSAKRSWQILLHVQVNKLFILKNVKCFWFGIKIKSKIKKSFQWKFISFIPEFIHTSFQHQSYMFPPAHPVLFQALELEFPWVRELLWEICSGLEIDLLWDFSYIAEDGLVKPNKIKQIGRRWDWN